MSQHKPLEPESPDSLERTSDPPEPTQSERRLRTSVTPSASERPGRPSVRPSAFGAPRPSNRPSRTSITPSAPPPSKPPRRFEEDEDDRDADTAPGLIFTAATSNPSKVSEPPSRPSSPSPSMVPVPTTARSSAPMPIPTASPPLQLVLAKTSLPDAPAHMAMPPAVPHAPSPDGRRTSSSVLVFGLMLAAAAVPIARYTMRRPPEPSPETAHSAARALPPTPVVKKAAPVPVAPPAPPAKIDRLSEIMAGLPAEAAQASQYLVDHAVRARDSGELALAETLLGRASALDDRNPHPAFALAQLRFEQGNYEGAEGWIANAVRLRPRRAEYRRLYAEILLRLGRDHEAHEEQRKAKRLDE